MNARQPPGTLDPAAPSVMPDPSGLDRQLAEALQDAIEDRDTGDVMDLVDANFRGSANLDPQSARRLLTATFLRYQNIKVVPLAPVVRIDPSAPTLGTLESKVVVTGALSFSASSTATAYGVTMKQVWVNKTTGLRANRGDGDAIPEYFKPGEEPDDGSSFLGFEQASFEGDRGAQTQRRPTDPYAARPAPEHRREPLAQGGAPH